MSNIIEQIKSDIEKNQLLKPRDTIIVGLSGGPDSIFLLHVLHTLIPRYQLTLIAAHLDHEWRESSKIDEGIARDAALSLGIMYLTKRACDIIMTKKCSGSKEDQARLLRREFFQSLLEEHHAQSIAVGHHQDDLIETFFIRLVRGAGLSGLASIRAKSGRYIRPLLTISKQAILAYLNEHNISFAIDPTNESCDYLRNRVRQHIIPACMQTDDRFNINARKTIEHLQAADDYIERQTTHNLHSISTISDGKLALQRAPFLSLDPFMQHRVLLAWLIHHRAPFTPSTTFFSEIIRFIHQPGTGSHTFYQRWKIKKIKELLAIQII